MKSLITHLILFFSMGITAQTAPDFSVTDTHGQVHNLYADYLDQGKTVVLDLFYVTCSPCAELAPYLETLYQSWGAGTGDVQFVSLTCQTFDDDEAVLGFEEEYETTWPAISADGGGPEAQSPYTDGSWGTFKGYPTLIVIFPDGTVEFDVWDNMSLDGTMEILDAWIVLTGAERPVYSSVAELENVRSFSVSPNPVSTTANIELDLDSEVHTSIDVYNSAGKLVKHIYNGSLLAGQQSINIPTSELISGSYFVKVSMNGQSRMEQFVKL